MNNTLTIIIGLRKQRKLSQKSLGIKINRSAREISFLENSKRPLKFEILSLYLQALREKNNFSGMEIHEITKALYTDILTPISKALNGKLYQVFPNDLHDIGTLRYSIDFSSGVRHTLTASTQIFPPNPQGKSPK